ncbi:hypothetical protein P3W66_11825 [Achromobacter denitrificans]|uniref:hypothetical protein n=1 Tax=Achromobacter denitrificans TaxID=32002 RepID=UPI0023E87E52|nr:hypothetical protein [Achromobacter denitrificans]MDF3940722.1 hypothetical protein [Achromobacter denitrificans]
MDLDDNGKERRNALIVCALLFSAAYLELKLPSFVAEYVKLEIAPAAQFKIWVLAAVLAGYVAMRYHFSPGRAITSEQERAAFAAAWLRSQNDRSAINKCKSDAYKSMLDTPGLQKAQRDGIHIFINQIEPIGITSRPSEKNMWVLWRLNDSLRPAATTALGGYDPLTSSELKVHRPKSFVLRWLGRQILWSRKAWEVNPVYLICGAAFYMCLTRAAHLAGGWSSLAHSFF